MFKKHLCTYKNKMTSAGFEHRQYFQYFTHYNKVMLSGLKYTHKGFHFISTASRVVKLAGHKVIQ